MGRDGTLAVPKLVRGLGTWDVGLITFSTIVGSAIFIAASIVPSSRSTH